MRLLFVKHSLVWPRSSGHDVHTYYMMKACAELGHDVSLATVIEPQSPALDGLTLKARFNLSTPAEAGQPGWKATKLQERFRSFWGVAPQQIEALRRAAGESRADAVVVVGLDALPYFPALQGVARVWYAADEWVLHHLSQVERTVASLREHLWASAVKGLYERAHRTTIDRAWVVSESDRKAMRWVAGVRNVDVLPNGVDGNFFRPGDEVPQERTAVFWGRLDFGPNIQALQWFFKRVWPLIHARVPDARFTIIGFQPTDAVRALAGRDGIALAPDVRDLRSTVRSHALAILPFVSGAGIKNKLLESAALGVPIVCTPLATRGLRGEAPLITGNDPGHFADQVIALWGDAARRRTLSGQLRTSVPQHHTWQATAREAMAALSESARRPDMEAGLAAVSQDPGAGRNP